MILNSAKLSGGRGVGAVQIVAGSLHIYGVTSLASFTFSPSSLSMIADSSSTLISLRLLSALAFAWECLPRSPANSRHERAAATLALLGASVSCITSLRVLTAMGARSVWYILCRSCRILAIIFGLWTRLKADCFGSLYPASLADCVGLFPNLTKL